MRNTLKIILLTIIVLGVFAREIKIIGPAEPRLKGPEVEISQPSQGFIDFSERWERKLPRAKLTEPVQIRLCVLRAQFQEDSNDRSTGNGQLDLRPFEESPYPIDPTPHNRAYFESHMLAVRNYWLLVSDSLIDITYDIYPIPGDIEAYTLPDSMAYYGPLGWFGNNLAHRMDAFIIDVMELAYERDHMDFTRYDDFVIFHAGGDMQNDVASTIDPSYLPFYDDMIPSPDDLPTGYKKIFREILPGVTGALIVPEFASQDGQVVAINGFLAHEIGHILGLVDLYSTYNMASMVGYFSLMDNGHIPGVQLEIDGEYVSVYGAIPTYPGAWDRAFLGIEDIIECDVSGEYQLTSCAEFAAGTTLVKIPINDYEYLLLENRNPNPDGRAINLKADPETGVIMGLIDAMSENFVAKYDFLLPGAGILVWHIDEYVAYSDYMGNGFSNWENNSLQWDFTRLFVDVLEADGFQDMGYYIDYGDSLDMFFEGNNSEITPHTRPSTNANSGAETGIYITDISEQGRRMTFNFRREGYFVDSRLFTGFPIENTPIVLDNDGEQNFFAFSNNVLLAWDSDGTRLLPGSDTLGLIGFSGDTARFAFPVVARLDTFITGFSLGHFEADNPQMAVAEENGNFTVFDISDRDSSGRLDPLYYFDAGEKLIGNPIFHDFNDDGVDEILLCLKYGEFVILNSIGDIVAQGDVDASITGAVCSGSNFYIMAEWTLGKLFKFAYPQEQIWEVLLDGNEINPPVISDINLDNDEDIILTSQDGYLCVVDENAQMVFSETIEDSFLSIPAIADISGDGYPDIVFTSPTKLHALNRRGIYLTGFPTLYKGNQDPNFTAPPSIASFENAEIMIPASNSDIYFFDFYGNQKTPLATGGSLSSIQFFDGENGVKGIMGSTNGSVYLLDFSIEGEGLWSGFASGNRARLFDLNPSLPYVSGDKIINPYIWPNPVGSLGHIRFGLGSETNVTIEIFSHDGVLVDEIHYVGNPGEINEIQWNTRGIASGIYRGRISAGDTKTFKIAIVK